MQCTWRERHIALGEVIVSNIISKEKGLITRDAVEKNNNACSRETIPARIQRAYTYDWGRGRSGEDLGGDAKMDVRREN